MREIPIHGKKYMLGGVEVTALDVVRRRFVKVLLPDGKIDAVPKEDLNLATIDTIAYEKISHDRA